MEDNQVINNSLKIVGQCRSFMEHLLTDSNEFFPFCYAINNNNELTIISYQNHKNDKPKSHDVITGLKEKSDIQLKNGQIISYGIAYDTYIKNDDNNSKTNCLVIEIKHKTISSSHSYSFPYQRDINGKIIFGEGFVN